MRKRIAAIVFVVLVVGVFALVMSPPVAACDDCYKDPATGQWSSPTGCCCSCASGGERPTSAIQKCKNGELASCSCNGDTGASSTGCSSQRNVISSTLFFQFHLVDGNMTTVGRHLRHMDQSWTFVLADGFSGGSPQSEEYTWDSGVDLATALNTIGADFGACAEVDYTDERVTFRPVGTCQ